MAGKNWREVRAQRALNEDHVAACRDAIEIELRLSDLRSRRGYSQVKLAQALSVSQPNVSRIEQEEDLYLSTLARYVAALGGHIEITAVFGEDRITLSRGPGAETDGEPGSPLGDR